MDFLKTRDFIEERIVGLPLTRIEQMLARLRNLTKKYFTFRKADKKIQLLLAKEYGYEDITPLISIEEFEKYVLAFERGYLLASRKDPVCLEQTDITLSERIQSGKQLSQDDSQKN